MSDVLDLTCDLIRRASVTPDDAGCQAVIAARLMRAGFRVRHLRFGEVDNLWATHGDGGPTLAFLGHTDVVPTGPADAWRFDPFEPTVVDGVLYGRGAADMKGSVAAMVVALEAFVAAYPDHAGRVGLLLTSDEEGPTNLDGVRRVVEHFRATGERVDWCVVGEPSAKEKFGDLIRVGRRGSLSGTLVVRGVQGHVAYPEKALNPIHAFAPALARLRALTVPALELRVMTHLARADERSESMTNEQVERFESTLAAAGLAGAHRPATSIGNSAGTLGWPRAQGDWVRPGLALYGVSPFGGETADKHGLKPAMTLETTVLTVRDVKRGETVGYAGAWRAGRDCSIAILAAGYGDGLPRHLESGTPVLIGDSRHPLVGRVSMDMIAVDVTGVPKVATGTKAVIWGEGLPVEEVATHADTIPYELLCGVSQRVPLELK